ncbi:serine/threonine protein kinase [Streptomyces fradiae ATCC 10745 = DSM 40063]|uniref:non-specific serine/threonine protein kinase n=2 Tax=Streptomyces TaxID=1883 RepID=A0A1Y2NUN4_STRFR|nr:Serine/threonine-protein kinase PrkC [Streptomyces fradiae ATCC 10745 = DSM 40063]QEV13460.1 serine/threonine protein kinase [Streptomyces fradiae ATCC 10745 = DSM 40063]
MPAMGELFAVGSTVAHGRYRIVDVIGGGGMAQVYRARDERLARFVALKGVRGDLLHDSGWTTRFQREAQTMAGLSHPNIVAVHDAGEEQRPGAGGRSIPYLVMELVPGRSLADLLRERGKLPLAEALRLASQVLSALAAAHARGVVHRDIKPANILLTEDGAAKVTDFGIAAVADRTALTRTGTVVGTPHYMSPEQVEGRRDIDGRSDLYSVGVLLFHLLSGRVPFDADSAWSIGYAHLHTPPPTLASVGVIVPAPVESVLARALAKNLEDRHQDAAAMRAAIDVLVHGEDEQGTRSQGTSPFTLDDLFSQESRSSARPRPGVRRTPLVRLVLLVPVLLALGWTMRAMIVDSENVGTITLVSACAVAWTWLAFMRKAEPPPPGRPIGWVQLIAGVSVMFQGMMTLMGLVLLIAGG